MGLASMASADEGMQLCIFDLRRGQREGQELDKILFFFPAECPFSLQHTVIGLCEGIITFTRMFSPDADCEVIELENRSYIFHQAEEDIWMVMVLEKSKKNESARRRGEALRGTLREVHSLFKMFHGPVRFLLDTQPNGELARNHLNSFITDYFSDLYVGKKIQMPSYRHCLQENGTVQMLTVSSEAALDIQSLVSVVGSCFGNVTCSSLILFQDLLVSTTLPPEDTLNIYTYAVMRLTPNSLSASTSWSSVRKGSLLHVPSISTAPNDASILEEHRHRSRDTSPRGQNMNYQMFRPLQRDKWFKGKDGFAVLDAAAAEAGSFGPLSPVLWLQKTDERMYLCVYQHKNLTIILLFPVSSSLSAEEAIPLLKKHLIDNASEKIVAVEQKLSKGWGGENAYHVSGYRYLMVDTDQRVSRASPPGKVATLTKDSLLAFNKLRAMVDIERSKAKRDNPDHEAEFEVCLRAKNNAWLICKISRGQELYMVLEKAKDTLLYATDSVEKFSNRYCGGAFSSG